MKLRFEGTSECDGRAGGGKGDGILKTIQSCQKSCQLRKP